MLYTYTLTGNTRSDSVNYGTTINAIKTLRNLFDLGLNQAKELVDGVNQFGSATFTSLIYCADATSLEQLKVVGLSLKQYYEKETPAPSDTNSETKTLLEIFTRAVESKNKDSMEAAYTLLKAMV